MKRTKNIDYFIAIANARMNGSPKEVREIVFNFAKNYLDGIKVKYHTCYAYRDEATGNLIECCYPDTIDKDVYLIFK